MVVSTTGRFSRMVQSQIFYIFLVAHVKNLYWYCLGIKLRQIKYPQLLTGRNIDQTSGKIDLKEYMPFSKVLNTLDLLTLLNDFVTTHNSYGY